MDRDAFELRRDLWEKERIQVRADTLLGPLTIRFSAQAYVEEADLARLCAALEKHGWPGK